MDFPVRLYHRDTDAYLRSGYAEYPILVTCAEEFALLEPGWCADPVAAANFVGDVPVASDEAEALRLAAVEAEAAAFAERLAFKDSEAADGKEAPEGVLTDEDALKEAQANIERLVAEQRVGDESL